MQCFRNAARRPGRRAEFQAAELVAVALMFAVVMASTVPTMMGIGKSRALAVAGEKVEQMITLARQNAVESNAPTALVLLTEQGSEADYRALTLVQCLADGTWRQITNWEPLPVGVIVDFDHKHCTFLDQSPPLEGLDGAQIGFRGHALTGAEFACRIFLPNGTLSNPETPALIRLVEAPSNGSNSETVGTYHRRTGSFYDIAIVGTTGGVQVSH